MLKMHKKMAGWKANTLSRGGKLTLIKANLFGIPNHVLSCFKCPKKVTTALNNQCRKFFRGNKSPPVVWDQACLIRPAEWFNRAALSKLGWKILTEPHNWWV